MAINLPNAPTNGQIFNQFVWDGTKWTASPGGASITVGDVAPTTPTSGALWWSSAPGDGQLYLYYADPNSSQWVVANHIGGGPYLALAGGTLTGALTLNGNASTNLQAVPLQQLNSAIAASPALNDTGRNYVQNPYFNIQQRTTAPWTANGAYYTFDRWLFASNLDTVNMVPTAAADTDRAAIGDESVRWVLAHTFTGNAGAAAYSEILQYIEGVRRLANKTVTLSFYASASAAFNLGISSAQVFGSGGSPSAPVGLPLQIIHLTTAWSRYSVQLSFPSIAGKTLGTNNNDYTQIQLVFSSGTANFPGVGVQSGTVVLWGVQLEVGSTMTPLEKVDPGEDLKRCQRFYQIGTADFNMVVPAAGTVSVLNSLAVPMRANPSVTYNVLQQTNNSGSPTPVIGRGASSIKSYISAAATGGFSLTADFTASADL
jgi:hypothetical protein